jgi:DNA-binding CsgD family transcriptional regulator
VSGAGIRRVGGYLERLRQRDLGLVVEFLGGLSDVQTLVQYSDHVLQGLRRMVACEHASYNELDMRERRDRFVIAPLDASAHVMLEVDSFRARISEHPVIAHYGKIKRSTGWLKVSDFVTRREFRQTGLYHDYYRRVRTEAQIGLMFPSGRGVDIAIALNRASGEFNERERLVLNLVRRHVQVAYERTETFDRADKQVALLMAGTTAGRIGIAILSEGRVATINETARAWLHDYFGGANAPDQVPPELESWLASHDGPSCSSAPHRVARTVGDRRLTVRAVRCGEEIVLLLEEDGVAILPATFASLGLSRRESEVLGWVARGKTNPEIGSILAVSPRTVQHHLETIFRKLDVETRTAAVARAFEA